MQSIVSILQTIQRDWNEYLDTWASVKEQTEKQCHVHILMQCFLLRNLHIRLIRITIHPRLEQRKTFLSYLLHEVQEELRLWEIVLAKRDCLSVENIQAQSINQFQQEVTKIETFANSLGSLCTLLGALSLMNQAATPHFWRVNEDKNLSYAPRPMQPSPPRSSVFRDLHLNQLINTVKGLTLTKEETMDLVQGAEITNQQILTFIKLLTPEPETAFIALKQY